MPKKNKRHCDYCGKYQIFSPYGYKRVPPKRLKKLINLKEYKQYSTRNKFNESGYLYKRGVKYERKAMQELRKEGALVVRSSRSGGPFDLWALFSDKLRLIQVKATKSKEGFSKLKEELALLKVPPFAQIELWIWYEREGWKKLIITPVLITL